MIAKTIHQLWVGPLPAPTHWMQSWRDHHPSWRYILWDEERIWATPFINQRHLSSYWERECWHGVADVVRYEVLYYHGGIMPGADSECVRPVDELFADNQYDAYVVAEHERLAPGLLSPLLAAASGSPFCAALVLGLAAKSVLQEPWQDAGNRHMMETAVLRSWPGLKVLPSWTFNPEHHTGASHDGTGITYAKQHWGMTRGLY